MSTNAWIITASSAYRWTGSGRAAGLVIRFLCDVYARACAHTFYAFYFIHTNADELRDSIKHQPLKLKSPRPSAAFCLSGMGNRAACSSVLLPRLPQCWGTSDGQIKASLTSRGLWKIRHIVSGLVPYIYEEARPRLVSQPRPPAVSLAL